MRILKFIGIGVAALIALAVGIGLTLPREWHVERSVTIQAKPEQVHALVADLKAWPSWTVWDKNMDPDVKHEFGGPEQGVGAWWSWNGPRMGHGKMTITRSDVASGVWIDEMIETDKEVNAHGSITWTAVEGGALKVSWKDDGTLPPVIGGYAKGMIEEMLGSHFQKGLEHLKAEAEKRQAAADAAAPAAQQANVTP
jgi:hypothetical protein